MRLRAAGAAKLSFLAGRRFCLARSVRRSTNRRIDEFVDSSIRRCVDLSICRFVDVPLIDARSNVECHGFLAKIDISMICSRLT